MKINLYLSETATSDFKMWMRQVADQHTQLRVPALRRHNAPSAGIRWSRKGGTIVRMADGVRGAVHFVRFSCPFLRTFRASTGTLVKLTKILPISKIFLRKNQSIKFKYSFIYSLYA